MPIVTKTNEAINDAIKVVEGKSRKVRARKTKKAVVKADKYDVLLEEKGISAPHGEPEPIISVLDRQGAGINTVVSTLAQLLHSGEDNVRHSAVKTALELHGHLSKKTDTGNQTQINIVIEGTGSETKNKIKDVLCPQR